MPLRRDPAGIGRVAPGRAGGHARHRTDDGTLTGYDVDVAVEVGKRIDAGIELVCQDWKGMIPALLAGEFDLIVASMSITEKRLKQIDFSGPCRVPAGQLDAARSLGLRPLATFRTVVR